MRDRRSWAHGLGHWLPFGILTVASGEPMDGAERFHAVLYP